MGIEGKCEGCGGTTFDYECPRCCAKRIKVLELQIQEYQKRGAAVLKALDDAKDARPTDPEYLKIMREAKEALAEKRFCECGGVVLSEKRTGNCVGCGLQIKRIEESPKPRQRGDDVSDDAMMG